MILKIDIQKEQFITITIIIDRLEHYYKNSNVLLFKINAIYYIVELDNTYMIIEIISDYLTTDFIFFLKKKKIISL